MADTAASYDNVARRYAEKVGDELDTRPLERGLLGAFVDLVGVGSRVADVGCGPGHVAAYLAGRGLAMSGIDLSPAMVEVARARVPGVVFETGSMLALPIADAALDGVLAWFSVIHLDDAERPQAYAEFARVVRADGWLALGFHVEGDAVDGYHAPGETAHLTRWWDIDVALDFHFLDPAVEIRSLEQAGRRIVARMDREPMIAGEPHTRRCYLIAHRT